MLSAIYHYAINHNWIGGQDVNNTFSNTVNKTISLTGGDWTRHFIHAKYLCPLYMSSQYEVLQLMMGHLKAY